MSVQNEIVVSQELQELINQFASAYMSSGELAQKILEQAKEENISNDQLRELIEGALKSRQLSKRQIIRAIPAELKRPYRRKPKSESDSMSQSGEDDTNNESDGRDLSDNDLEESDAVGEWQQQTELENTILIPSTLYPEFFAAIRLATDNHMPEIKLRKEGNRIVAIDDPKVERAHC